MSSLVGGLVAPPCSPAAQALPARGSPSLLYLRLLGAGAVGAPGLSLGDHLLLALVGGAVTPTVAPTAGANAGEVDAQLLGRPQKLVILFAELHGALLRDQVDVEAEALDLLQQ